MPSPKGIPVTIGGEARTLRLSNYAIAKLEMATQLSFAKIQSMASEGSLVGMGGLVWAGRLHAEPGLSFEDGMNGVSLTELSGPLGTAVGEMLVQHFGGAVVAAEGSDPKAGPPEGDG